MDKGFLNLVKDLAEQIRSQDGHHENCNMVHVDCIGDYYLHEDRTCDCGYMLAEHVLEAVEEEEAKL